MLQPRNVGPVQCSTCDEAAILWGLAIRILEDQTAAKIGLRREDEVITTNVDIVSCFGYPTLHNEFTRDTSHELF